MPRSHLGLVRKTWLNNKKTGKGQNMTKRYNHELLTVDVAIMIFACFELTLGNGLKSKISRILLRVLYRWTYSGREITISDSCHGSKLWAVRRTFHCTDVKIDDGAVKVSVFFERCPGVFVHEITKHSSSVLQRRIEWVMSWKNQSSRHSKTGNEVKLKKPLSFPHLFSHHAVSSETANQIPLGHQIRCFYKMHRIPMPDSKWDNRS